MIRIQGQSPRNRDHLQAVLKDPCRLKEQPQNQRVQQLNRETGPDDKILLYSSKITSKIICLERNFPARRRFRNPPETASVRRDNKQTDMIESNRNIF
jgi:hypothetical protein